MRYKMGTRTGLRVVSVILLSALLAGCVSGDDNVEPGSQNDASSGEGATVQGQVMTVDLDAVLGARVAVVADGELVSEARTDDQGDYTITGLEAGEYRVQVTAPCCRESLQGIALQEDETLDLSFQLELFTEEDLQVPYSVPYDWTGFYSCGAGTPAITWSTCATIEDPNHDWSHGWDVDAGLESTVIAMDWNPVGGASGDQLMLIYECWDECDGEHASASGEPPLEFRADGFPDDEWGAGYRVFPPFDVTVIYQQEFTVYWEEFYFREAPEGYSVLPDN